MGGRSLRWRKDYDSTSSDVPLQTIPLYAAPVAAEASPGTFADGVEAAAKEPMRLFHKRFPTVGIDRTPTQYSEEECIWLEACCRCKDAIRALSPPAEQPNRPTDAEFEAGARLIAKATEQPAARELLREAELMASTGAAATHIVELIRTYLASKGDAE